MGRIRSLTFAVIGVAGIYAGVENHFARFSDPAIFARMKPLIGGKYGKSRQWKKLKFQELRDSLSAIPESDREQRCKFAKRFAAEIKEGSAEKGLERLKMERFHTYGDCTTWERTQTSVTRWYTLVGIAAFLYGVITFAKSFRRRGY